MTKTHKFSIVKFIREYTLGQKFTGLEAELKQEFENKNKRIINTGLIRGVPLPISYINRDMTVNPDASGGYLVGEEDPYFVQQLREKMVLTQLGAQYFTGLVGNQPLPTEEDIIGSNWPGEIGDAVESVPSFSRPIMEAKRCASYITVSGLLHTQIPLSIEQRIFELMILSQALAVDRAAIASDGDSGDSPIGFIHNSDIPVINKYTDGGQPVYNDVIDMETAVAVNDGDAGSLGYLTNSKVRAILKKTAIESGSGRMVWGAAPDKLNGYSAGVTNMVPDDLTKGTGTGLSAMIFGDFKHLAIGQWGVIDLMIDPYTLQKDGSIQVTVNGFYDVKVLRAKSFVMMNDLITA